LLAAAKACNIHYMVSSHIHKHNRFYTIFKSDKWQTCPSTDITYLNTIFIHIEDLLDLTAARHRHFH
jgi:hypothetical protein